VRKKAHGEYCCLEVNESAFISLPSPTRSLAPYSFELTSNKLLRKKNKKPDDDNHFLRSVTFSFASLQGRYVCLEFTQVTTHIEGNDSVSS
jgi:hypothetical protein